MAAALVSRPWVPPEEVAGEVTAWRKQFSGVHYPAEQPW